MKKLKKVQLKIDKEVISNLNQDSLEPFKGGAVPTVDPNTCDQHVDISKLYKTKCCAVLWTTNCPVESNPCAVDSINNCVASAPCVELKSNINGACN